VTYNGVDPPNGRGSLCAVSSNDRSRFESITRSRLLERCEGRPFVILTAPSGYGKTSLARDIAAAAGGPTAWARFTDTDQLDGGSTRLLEALRAIFPHLGDQPPVADTTGRARLTYALEAVAGPAAVVLDDVELLGDTSGPALQALRDRSADDLHIIVTSQEDPPADVARWIADGRATLLGASELLFDQAECDLLADSTGSVLTGAQIADRSGGWPSAAVTLARSPDFIDERLVADAFVGQSEAAHHFLAALARVSSLPRTAIEGATERELLRLARRHPAVLDVDAERWRLREVARSQLLELPVDEAFVGDLIDRLDRSGQSDESLMLLARIDGDRRLLQDRLDRDGARLLASGRFALVRDLITQVPSSSRRHGTSLLDAAAALGLDQLELRGDSIARVDLAVLDQLEATTPAQTRDDQLALAGIRTEFLRRRGDASLVAVALGGLELLGPDLSSLPPGTDPSEVVAGLGPLARRGLFQVMYGLGVAASFSGDPAMITEGARLADLAFAVAERAGIDPLPLRGQFMYERMAMGLAPASSAIAPLEAGIAALRSIGHPEAANQLVELADVLRRLGEHRSALAATDAALDWAERTGNSQVNPSIELVRAGIELDRDGPSAENDQALEVSWVALSAGARLRRAASGFAGQVANSMLDQDDHERAAAWLGRARALLGDRVQSGYQERFIESVAARLRFLSSEPIESGPVSPGDSTSSLLTALPAGDLERRLTIAWDQLRRGDGGPAAAILADPSVSIEGRWFERLGRPVTPRVDPLGPELRIRLLCPELRIERRGHPGPTPTGHAARLLALIVVAGGVMTVDAALEDLWPDADPNAARNRFHQILLRLRRSLGVTADGLISVTDGVIRLDPRQVSTDVWDLRSLDPLDRITALAAIDSYESALCAAQFAYDDAFDDARWESSRRFVDVVAAQLAGDGARDSELVDAVWRAWNRWAEEDRLGLELADALERTGQAGRAEEIRQRLLSRSLRH